MLFFDVMFVFVSFYGTQPFSVVCFRPRDVLGFDGGVPCGGRRETCERLKHLFLSFCFVLIPREALCIPGRSLLLFRFVLYILWSMYVVRHPTLSSIL